MNSSLVSVKGKQSPGRDLVLLSMQSRMDLIWLLLTVSLDQMNRIIILAIACHWPTGSHLIPTKLSFHLY